MNGWVILAACLAGGVGATLRWGIDEVVTRAFRGRFPLGIFIVNVTGSFALGLVAALLGVTPESNVVGMGFLGGYTTFSTVAVASVTLWDSGQKPVAIANLAATFIVSVLAAGAGVLVGTAFRG